MRTLHVAVLVCGLAVAQHLPAPAGGGDGQALPSGDAAARVDDYLSRLVPYGFSGAILIASDGRIVLKKGYGLANRSTGQPYTPDLVSSIGSVTKQFTGAAIVRLEMDGRLRTSDPISMYLPGVPPDKASITIHHLLTHTAGFAGDLGGADDEPIARDALVAMVLAAPLESAPGERFEYSNEGYSLAGAIVERASGQSYEAYLREHLWLPAGMKDTGYLLPAWPLERLPIGYRQDGAEWGRIYRRGWAADGPGWYLHANGGIHSTLDDLYRWHLALEGHQVLSQKAVGNYQTGHVPSHMAGERYGYGWGVLRTRRGTTVIAHNGGNGIFFTDFRRYMDEKVVIIAMSNQGVVPATELAPRQIEALFFGDGPVLTPPRAVAVPDASRDALTGTYALESGGSLHVRATGSGLDVTASDPTLFPSMPVTPPGGKFAALEARTVSLVREAARGNFRPLFEAFDDERPFEVVQGNQEKIWAGWREEHGDFAGVESIGTSLVQGDPAVNVRLDFTKGRTALQFIWGPRRLAAWRALPSAGPVALVAESPEKWVFYSYRLPHLITVTFGSGGSITVDNGARRIAGEKQ